ncbi:MAG: TerC family protein [Chloroflexi bacterium]|nr:TerC family protein [Chloroflexota bacterium]
MQALADPQIWIALFTLLALEIVLGVDNIVFISILAGKLPEEQQDRARLIGLGLAMLMRVLLLFSLSWLIGLEEPFVTILGFELSGRDLILAVGGLFLIGKSTFEIHENLEGEEGHAGKNVQASFGAVIAQIVLLDAVFSLDSVITAVGIAEEIWVMIVAVVVAIGVMMVASGPIAEFVDRHPTVKILALSFLLMIGLTLIVEALHVHIPKGYIYSAMGFSVLVEALQLRMQANRDPVKLHRRYKGEGGAPAASD